LAPTLTTRFATSSGPGFATADTPRLLTTRSSSQFLSALGAGRRILRLGPRLLKRWSRERPHSFVPSGTSPRRFVGRSMEFSKPLGDPLLYPLSYGAETGDLQEFFPARLTVSVSAMWRHCDAMFYPLQPRLVERGPKRVERLALPSGEGSGPPQGHTGVTRAGSFSRPATS